jgi:hypothetical protein
MLFCGVVATDSLGLLGPTIDVDGLCLAGPSLDEDWDSVDDTLLIF